MHINKKLVQRYLFQSELISILYDILRNYSIDDTEQRRIIKRKIRGAQRHMSAIVNGKENDVGHVVGSKHSIEYWNRVRLTKHKNK